LFVPKGLATRPATDRVRESIFNLIRSRRSFDGATVLDLFAGTGSLGLEALSRGASVATFVETRRGVIRIARKNAVHLGVENRCSFYQHDAVRFARTSGTRRYDLVFADPPYELEVLPDLPAMLVPLLNEGGLLLLEHDRRLKFDGAVGWIESRAYGRTIVSIFASNEAAP